MDTFDFKGVLGHFRPKDREYIVRDGEYVQRPDGKVFLVKIDEHLDLIPIEAKDLPEGTVVVDLVKFSLS